MKNTKKILLGYLFAMMFVLGATLVGCGSDNNCSGKAPTGECANCTNTDNNANLCD